MINYQLSVIVHPAKASQYQGSHVTSLYLTSSWAFHEFGHVPTTLKSGRVFFTVPSYRQKVATLIKNNYLTSLGTVR
jgi:hypothetical protein